MKVQLKLVVEKQRFLNHLTKPKLIVTFLFLIALPTFFVIPFLSEEQVNWFPFYYFSLVLIFLVSWIIMLFKFYSKYDHQIIGDLFLTEDKITFISIKETKEFDLQVSNVKLLYNGIRNKGFHYGRDYRRSGISEITINKNEKIYTIVACDEDFDRLKKILKIWYQQEFKIEEYTRTPEEYRLIELEQKFEWKRLQEIKNNFNKP